jgi:uncharacterized protein (DUF2147 family)
MLSLVCAFGLAAQDAPETSLSGYWTNSSRSVVILIASCGEDRFCGTVHSASEKAQADAARGGTTKLIGAELLNGFVLTRPGRWKGQLFIPDLNERSRADIVQLDSDRLRVRGCAVAGLLCRSQTWSRTTGP